MTAENDPFGPLIGKLVKVVYYDGGQVKVRKGTLLAANSDFIRIETLAYTYVIRCSAITELRVMDGGGGAHESR